MRGQGRTLLTVTPGQNICVSCAHRLGATRRSSHVQKRLLSVSRPISKPPTSAEATLNQAAGQATARTIPTQKTSWGKPVPGPYKVQASIWGKSTGIPASSSTAGGTGAMKGIPSNGIAPAAGPEQPARNVIDELLPHEQAARDRMLEAKQKAEEQAAAHRDTQRRARPSLHIHKGPGPRTNRAGRSEPVSGNPAVGSDRAERERERSSRDVALEKHLAAKIEASRVREELDGNSRFFIQDDAATRIARAGEMRKGPAVESSSRERTRPLMIRHCMGEGRETIQEYRNGLHAEADTPESHQWKQLRKQSDIETSALSPSPNLAVASSLLTDRFPEDRAHRREWSKAGKYTPLNNRLIKQDMHSQNSSRNTHDRNLPRLENSHNAAGPDLHANDTLSRQPAAPLDEKHAPNSEAPLMVNSQRVQKAIPFALSTPQVQKQPSATSKPPAGPAYTTEQWQQDAAYIAVIKEEMDNGHFLNLKPLIRSEHLSEANVILRIYGSSAREKNKARARDLLQQQPPVEHEFTAFLKNFQNGPAEEAEESEETEHFISGPFAVPGVPQRTLSPQGRPASTEVPGVPQQASLSKGRPGQSAVPGVPQQTSPSKGRPGQSAVPGVLQQTSRSQGRPGPSAIPGVPQQVAPSRGRPAPSEQVGRFAIGRGAPAESAGSSTRSAESQNKKPPLERSQDPFELANSPYSARSSTAGQGVGWSPLTAAEKSRAITNDYKEANVGSFSARDQNSQRSEFREETYENAGSKARKTSKRSEWSPASETDAAAKGKAKDKAKRRQQFTKEGDRDEDAEDAKAERIEAKRKKKAERAAAKRAAPIPILLPEFISVYNLAVALKVKIDDFQEKLEELGYGGLTNDYVLNGENAGLIAGEYNFEAILDRGQSGDLKAREPAEDPTSLPQRPPVVTIMGHVDHGKTTILDYLRKSSVAASEHGGITQHIGAFSVPMPSGKVITFLDTPGHAAFLSMRQRGANVTDIVILVVAADDSVKPQTVEAINHAKAAKVPVIVAINKIDKEDSDIDKVKHDLARHGVEIEDFGGDTQVVCISGKTGEGMPDLEEAAVTLAEMIDMRAEVDGPAEGWVIEASIKSMGKVATVLVRRGTMRLGDFIVAGQTWARIRCLRNEAGVEIHEAGPGTPVEVDGWREQPVAGDEVLQAPDEAKAKSVIEVRLERAERNKMAEDMEAINAFRGEERERRDREKAEKEKAEAAKHAKEITDGADAAVDSAANAREDGPKPVYFIVKGDVSGSVEAVLAQISQLGTKEVEPIVLRSGVGQLSEFDVEHAAIAKGHLINFNTVVEPNILGLAAKSQVSILDQNIIYRLVDDVRAEMSKYLPTLKTQKVLGEADVAQVFSINVKGRKYSSVAGCKVRNGVVGNKARVRVLRDGEMIFDGTLSSLKSGKRDATEITKGSECGMAFEGWSDFQLGDQVQTYEEREEQRYL